MPHRWLLPPISPFQSIRWCIIISCSLSFFCALETDAVSFKALLYYIHTMECSYWCTCWLTQVPSFFPCSVVVVLWEPVADDTSYWATRQVTTTAPVDVWSFSTYCSIPCRLSLRLIVALVTFLWKLMSGYKGVDINCKWVVVAVQQRANNCYSSLQHNLVYIYNTLLLYSCKIQRPKVSKCKIMQKKKI